MKSFLASALLFLSFSGAAWGADTAKPNVVLLLTDDQGYGDLSCHGNPVLKTPRLDRLHDESVRFTDFHVEPMCSPTRGEIMTGICAFRNGATAVCQGRSMPRRELPTMAQFFKDNGYATAHFGKWHLGDNYPFHPQNRGFDLSIHNQAYGVSSLAEYWKNDATDDHYWWNDELKELPGYNTDGFFREAMSWIKEQKGPFFVYLATTAAHSPFNVPQNYVEPYRELGPNVSNFFGMIANLDENYGRLDDFLSERGLRENTIVIYMTDNGTVAGEKVFNAGMRDHKTSEYDGGHRVPLFMRWPAANWGAPRDVDTLVHAPDLLPTLIDLCGLKNERGAKFDGRSLAPLLRGQASDQSFTNRMVVVKYGMDFESRQDAVLWNKWRLVGGNELYDVATDPGQRTNLHKQRPEIVKAMRAFYDGWIRETRPVIEQTNVFGVGDPSELVTWLSSCNWTGDYCDNWGNLASGSRFGFWNMEVMASDEYEVSLYLFHPDSQTPLNGSMRNVPARPIAKARLIIDGEAQTIDTKPDDTHATFHMMLAKGRKLKLEGQFLDAEGKPLFGAAYTFVKRGEGRGK